ncbi:uncharacterized protein LOC116163526 isoform X2 [Photinus pyralis]|nr:uncharacterized protein LOC116163526 isoform X2 [Photinus pyralis]
MTSEKPYAVIYFESEKLYSEVPVSWLTTDRQKCWWPKSVNAKPYMTRGDKPQENWILYNVRVEKYCSTLKSARLKAEDPDYVSSSNETQEKGRGLRKKLPKRYVPPADKSSSDEGTITPPPSPTVKVVSLEDVIVVEVPPDEFPSNTNSDKEQPSSSTQGSPHRNLDAGQDDIQIFADTYSEIDDSNVVLTQEMIDETLLHNLEIDQPSKKCDCQKSILKEVYIKTSKLEKMMEEIMKIFSSLKTSNNIITCNEQKLDLLAQLPLKHKQDIIDFDHKITNEQNMKDTYANFLRGIGGKDVKDFVNRCLTCLFTNELGKLCSLVGQRGNLRLDEYTFIKIFQEIVAVTKGSSRYEVEKAIGEWFRLSNQRLNRANKKERK